MIADAGLLQVNGTFFVELAAFLIVLAILSKTAYPKIISAAESRQNQIEDALKSAEQTRTEASAALADAKAELDTARQQARDVIDRAKREAAADVEELRKKAQAEAQAQVQQAQTEIAAERDRAIRELRTQVGALVVAAAGQVLGESIDAPAHERLIQESLAKLEPGDVSRN